MHPPAYLLLPDSWGRWDEDDIDEPLFQPAGPRVGEGGLLLLHASARGRFVVDPERPTVPAWRAGSIIGGCGT